MLISNLLHVSFAEFTGITGFDIESKISEGFQKYGNAILRTRLN